MGKSQSKEIGRNYEYRVLAKFRKAGLKGRRLPLSMEQDNPKVDLKLDDGRTVQCKYNFQAKRIYEIMDLIDMLVIRRRERPNSDLIIMHLDDYLKEISK